MAHLARYGNVAPSEFEQMLEDDAVALAKQVGRLHKGDQELLIELAKGVMKSSAGR
jgi:hypothetical protein